MNEKSISFYSEGHKLTGTIYLPEDYQEGQKRPAVICNSGYQGFNEFYPKMFAQYLTKAGYICFGFDYRGFADSEGEQGHVIIDEQVEDIKNCLTYAQTCEQVDPERIAVLGWGMAAPHVVKLGATDRRAKAVVALNGFYNGSRWLKSIHTPEGWNQVIEHVEEDRVRRVTTGKSKRVDPFMHYVLDPATADYVQSELAPLAPFGKQIDLQFTESIIGMKTEGMASGLTPTPLFVGHGKDNLLHPKAEAKALYEAASSPKHMYWIEGKHNDFMYYDHPVMNQLIEQIESFLSFLDPTDHNAYTSEAVLALQKQQ